ncbi:MAG: hypothetical protein ACK5NE_02675 [Brachymonas sp.]
MKTVVETFFVALLEDRVRWYRTSMELESADTTVQTPDDAVHSLVHCCQGQRHDCQHFYLSHSTSWRFESPNNLVLSYIVYPYAQHVESNKHEWQETLLKDLRLIHSHSPSDPCLPMIESHHVLSHALRHLALLTHGPASDAVVRSHLPEPARRFLSQVVPALAGQLPQLV